MATNGHNSSEGDTRSAGVAHIFPLWTQTLGLLWRSNALVRAQCRVCGIQQRVDTETMALKLGREASPIDHAERCNIVACHGTVFYMAARTYGRQWISLTMRADGAPGAAACTAYSLGLLNQGVRQ